MTELLPPSLEEPRPVMLLIGYLAGVNEKDALSYARGQAAQYSSDLSNTRVFVAAFEGGMAFEVQEGSPGLAYLPKVLERFQSAEAPTMVHILTGTRTLRIDKETRGLSAVWLPESDTTLPLEEIEPTTPMQLAEPDARWALNYGVRILAGGLALFFLAGGASMAVTSGIAQPPDAGRLPAYSALPHTQWADIVKVPAANPRKYVTSVEYVSGRWKVKTAEVPTLMAEPGTEGAL